ncbi:glycosyltransferase family 4 protein [Lelliottia amnigena]
MKIVHIVHNFYGFSGASLQAKNLAEAIVNYDKSTEQFFVTRLKNGPEKKLVDKVIDDFFVVEIPAGISRILTFIKFCLKVKPDIAHFHGADFGLLVTCRILNIKVYWKSTLLGSDDFSSLIGSSTKGIIKKKLLSCIDVNNTLTKQIYDINSHYLPPSKLVTIPNGVEAESLDKIVRNERLAVIISAIIPRKKILEGIDFFKQNLAHKGYMLLIFGPYDSGLDGYNKEYVKQCLSFADSNIIFKGNVNHSEIKTALSKVGFLIHLSEKEGMPNVVLEAMGRGVYPIVSEMNGLAYEIIKNEKCGYITSSSKKFSIENYMGINKDGMKIIAENYEFKVVAAKTCQIYELLYGDK